MSKHRKSLPMLIIKNEEDGSEIYFVNRAYILTALQGLQIYNLQGNQKAISIEVDRLLDELKIESKAEDSNV